MPRPCSICIHPQRQAIDHALTAGEAFRNIASRFGTSVTALHRHKHEHLLGHLAHVQQSQTPTSAAQDTQPIQQTHTAPLQAPTPQLSSDVWQALATYRQAAQDVERLRTQDWRRSPYSPGMAYDPAVRKLEVLRKKCLALDVDPERDR